MIRRVSRFCLMVLLLSYYLGAGVFAGDRVEQLNAQLPRATCKEKIKRLAELTDLLGNNAPRQVIENGQQALDPGKDSPDSLLELSKQRNTRVLLAAVCVLVLLLAIVIYYIYRSKARVNRELREEILHHQQTSTRLREAERERFKSRNLESIGVLAGGIAHDFNNLLSVILGNISLAKVGLPGGDELYSLLEQAEKASMEAARLAGKMLTFSRGDLLIKKKVEISQVMQEAVAINPLGSQYSLQRDFLEPLMPVDGDQRQLAQVVANLLQNACDAMPQGGIITVSAENVFFTAHNKLDLVPGSYVHLSIQDSGSGIPEENIGKVFDPYFTTRGKGEQKGTGMGLAVCYAIIRKHKGYITITSEQGKGTVADFYLPVFIQETFPERGEKEKAVPFRSKEKPPPKEKIKVLLMDDEEAIIKINRDMLESLGFTVSCFREGSEAINAYRHAKKAANPFDIVILDIINYRGMGGKDTLQHILSEDPGVRSIAISGYLRDIDIDGLRSSGFDEVLLKPYNPSQLESAINTVLSQP
jgi:signal transduction histidine kinase/CheY-like chemotaxis protein